LTKPINAAASAPAQLDKYGSLGTSQQESNGVDSGFPPITHLDDSSPQSSEEKMLVRDKEPSNDTTDRNSQATSATTYKMPLSPNTPGTSVMSRDSEEKRGVSTSGGLSSIPSQVTNSTGHEADETNGNNKSPFRGLRKKASS